MIELTFSRAGREDIVLTEDDLFDFRFERDCFSGDTFELGGVSAKSIYMIIDNNTQRFPRGAFANSRVRLDIDGHFCGYFNAELPKRRNGVIELTAYDDMIKLDTEFPEEVQFPQTFISVYGHCVLAAGLADHFSIISGDTFVLNALFNNGVISHEYTDYIYANSCRNVVSGMAEWNGGFAYINDDGKLQVDVFSKEVSRTFYSGELMDFDYSDETVVFSKIKTSQKNKTYEMGDDSGYTLIINNQYISYGLDDEDFEMYLGFIYDYYKDFSLMPMSFTLAEPDFSLKIGDRISVVDEEENVTVTGNISEISVSGNCSMTVTCGGFGNVSGVVNYNKSSTGLNNQTKAGAGSGGVGKAAESDPTSEYFNDYTGNAITGKYPYPYPNSPYEKGYNRVEGHKNTLSDSYGTHVRGAGNTVSRVIDSHIGGNGNTVEGGCCLLIQGGDNAVYRWEDTDGSKNLLLMGEGNKAGVSGNASFSIVNGNNCYLNNAEFSIILGNENRISKIFCGLVLGSMNEINSDYTFAFGKGLKTDGNGTANNSQIMLGQYNAVAKQIKPKSTMSYGYNILFSLGAGTGSSASRRSTSLIIDELGNIYCNKIYELGSKITSDMVTEKGIIDASSLINKTSTESTSAAQAARTISAAASSDIPIVLLDHTPTADDLTGSPCVFLQCQDTAEVEGETTGIFRVTDIFAEKVCSKMQCKGVYTELEQIFP